MTSEKSVFIGIIINPKTFEPCPIYKTKKRTVNIYNSTVESEGKGYFDDGNHGPEYSASERSGYPRVHTPDGVRTKRRGYGTVLYTGMCLAAHLENERELDLYVQTSGDGISSNSHRSREADSWWAYAKERGLAESVEVEGHEPEPEEEDWEATFSDYELDSISRREKFGQQILAVLSNAMNYQGEGESPTGFSIDITGVKTVYKEAEDTEADVYYWDNAKQFVPIRCVCGMEPEELSSRDPKELAAAVLENAELDPDVFATINIAGASPQLVQFLEAVAKKSGMVKQWEAIMYYAATRKRLEDSDIELDDLYATVRPFLNPTNIDKLNNDELRALTYRAKISKKLGLDKFSDAP